MVEETENISEGSHEGIGPARLTAFHNLKSQSFTRVTNHIVKKIQLPQHMEFKQKPPTQEEPNDKYLWH